LELTESTVEEQVPEEEYSTTTDSDFDVSQVAIIREVNSLRTESSKTFQKADGSFVVVLYNDVIHYDENGIFKQIDNSLFFDENNEEYQNNANKYSIKLPKSLDENKKIKLSLGEYSIDWIVQNIDKTDIEYQNNTEPSNNIKELKNINQEVMYKGIQNNVDLEYFISGSKIKENIILNKYIEDFSISFTYLLKDLSIQTNENGENVFLNNLGEEIFSFQDLYMYDNEGNESKDINFDIIEVKSAEYMITITPNDEWLQDANFPVILDPTISSKTQSMLIYDTFVSESNPDVNYGDFPTIRLENLQEKFGLFTFDMPSLLTGKQITYAHLIFEHEANLGYPNTISLYKNTTRFVESTVKWSNKPNCIDQMTDYDTSDSSVEYVFDIIKDVKEWQENSVVEVPGYTMKIYTTTTGYETLYSSENTNSVLRPVIEFGYLEPSGVKDYWTYNSQNMGVIGTGYVSDYTGKLVFIRNDINYSTELQSLNLSFAFNDLNKTSNIGYGAGWNIIYNTKLTKVDYQDKFFTTDYTGNTVYYHRQDYCSERVDTSIGTYSYDCYLAEDGSSNILVRVFHYYYHFLISEYILTPDMIKQNFNSEGYLISIQDSNTNLSITISRNSTNQNKVEQVIDSSGNKIDITYGTYGISLATLSLKQDDDTYKMVEKRTYTYTTILSSQYTQRSVTHRKDYNLDGTFTADETVYFLYDSLGRISRAYLSVNDTLYYYYNTTSQVTKITSYFSSYKFSEVNYDYQFKHTTITNHRNEYIIYEFDDYGHTILVMDSFGNLQSKQYYNPFSHEVEPNYYINNQIRSTASSSKYDLNKVLNHDFEQNDSSYLSNPWNLEIENAGLILYNRSTLDSYAGSISGNLETNDSASGNVKQSVNLDAGTYTLSGYIKNCTSSNQVYIDILGVSTKSNIEYVLPTSEWGYYDVQFTINTDNTPVTIKIYNHSTGTIYFDDIYITEGFDNDGKNVIDNPSFENGCVGWNFSSGTYLLEDDLLLANEDVNELLGDSYVSILGDPNEVRYASVDISKVFSGTFTVGGWIYYQGAPLWKDIYEDRFVQIIAVVSDLNSLSSIEHKVSLYQNVNGWQYVSQSFYGVYKEYTISLRLEFLGEGAVCFDGLQLINNLTQFSEYTYDEIGRVTIIKNSNGDEVIISYDNDIWTIPTAIITSNKYTEITLNEEGEASEITFNKIKSSLTRNVYNQVEHLTIGDEYNSFTTSTTYNLSNQYITYQTDEFGNDTNYFYEEYSGLLRAIENAKGEDLLYLYDDEGKLTETIFVEDYTNYTSSDIHGQISYVYDTKDRLIEIVMDEEYSYFMIYDSQNRISEIKVNNQTLMSYSYEMDGLYYTNNLQTQTYGNLDSIKFEYNDNNQIEKVQFKNYEDAVYTDKFIYVYDAEGRMAQYYDVFEDKTEYYVYDGLGRIIEVFDDEGNSINYGYDLEGNLNSLHFQANEISQVTEYFYNKELYFNQYSAYNTESMLYDRTDYTTNSDNEIIKEYNYEANALYRLHFIQLSINLLNIKQDFTYYGNTTRITQISYDISEDGIDYKYVYEYDELGNITEISYYESYALITIYNYFYDELNQLIVEDIYVSGDSCEESDICYTNIYTYDSRGNILEVNKYNYNERDEYEIPDLYYFNDSGVVVKMYYNSTKDYRDIYVLNVGQSPTLTFTYFNPLTMTYYSGVTTSQTFSNLNTSIPGYYYREYRAYSSIGVDIQFRIIFNVGNVLEATPYETKTYEYSDTWLDQLESYDIIINGNSSSQEFTYDNQGNPISIDYFTYNGTAYDSATLKWSGRQLTQIDINNSSSTVFKIKYYYNDQGYRIRKELYTCQELIETLTETIEYTLLGDSVIYETHGTYQILYTYDYDGTLISFNYDNDDYFYFRNQQGDITHILDTSGNTIVKYRYDAYGNIIDIQDVSQNCSISSVNSYTYRGYRFDSEINMYYLNSRYYNPEIGRFINADGLLGQTGNVQSTNMYAYCANNPVMYLDPSGFFSISQFFAGSLLVLTAVAAISISIATFGAATPLAMTIIAGITLGAGVLTGINGLSTIGESFTEYNLIRDGLFNNILGLSDNAYNTYSAITAGVAIVGSMACSIWQIASPIKGFTDHGLKQALFRDGHGVAGSAIRDAVRNPLKVILQPDFALKYFGKNAVVVLNELGYVVTTYATNHLGWRF